jgi:hypothetical protein
MDEEAMVCDSGPQSRNISNDVRAGSMVFATLKKFDKILTLVSRVRKSGRFRGKRICAGMQKREVELGQGAHSILRSGFREHLNMNPVVFL